MPRTRQLARVPSSTTMLNLPGRISKTGWALPANLTLDEWIACGRLLSSIEGSVQWWLGDWWAFGNEREWGEGETIADTLGVNYQTIRNYASVARAFELSRRRDNLDFSLHETVAAMTPRQQDKWLDRAEREDWSQSKLRSAIAQAKATDNTRAVAFEAGTLGRNVILYADPPWRYENPPLGGHNRAIENHYPTMTLEEICALPVADIAHENSMLFLWATAPKLAECMQVITAWGFVYRTNMIWDKEMIGMGYHVRNQHEILLIAKRGELAPPAPENRPASIVRAPRGEHSEKPDTFCEIIEKMYPEIGEQKIELFARTPRPGWHSWGNCAALLEAAE